MKRLVTVLATLLVLAPAAAAEREIEESHPMAAAGELRVINPQGRVDVRAWDREELRIVGRLGRHVEAFEVTGDADSRTIEVRVAERREDATELVLDVPRAVHLELTGVSSDFAVDGLETVRLRIETVSGDANVAANVESLDVEIVSGDLVFEGIAGRAAISTVSGDVNLDRAERELSLRTVSGDGVLAGSAVERLEIESVSGEALFRGTLAPGADVAAQTVSGEVILELPRELSARVEAQTMSGDIVDGYRDAAAGGRGDGLEFTLGDGDARLRLQTFSGDITLRPMAREE